jgi:cytochrome c553
MILPLRPLALAMLGIFLAAARISAAEDPAADAQAARFFETKIRPVLVARCYECHGPESKREGNLRLDSRAAMLNGGDIGAAIKPGNPKGSLLIDAINHGDIVQMPPKTKLPAQEIADLTAWVAQGAAWPGDMPPDHANPGPRATPAINDNARDFWAFQTPREPTLPAVADAAWPRSPLDHFILSALEARGLKPASPAEKRALIRRATFDLHGLPPTPEEVDAFLSDTSSEAFAKVIDRLLASPRYGERWARRWLDIARYADSNGMDENMAMAEAWRYRDYVVGAFNKDMPYDQFVQQQLAGDLLAPADDATNFERLVATAFLVLGPKMLAEDDPVKMEMDIIDEQVDTIGRALMGLSLGCARCHDHKFDPIPTADYYSLAGIFKSTKTMENYRVVAMWSERPLATSQELARLAAHDEQIARVTADIRAATDAANDKLLSEARGELAKYLLAAGSRERRKETLAALAAELETGQVSSGALVIEAEKYARGNVVRDFTTYGQGIGVIYNAGPLPNVAEYDIELPAAGTYQVALRYAAAEARGVRLALDGRPLRSDAAGDVTGSWAPEGQRWSIEDIVALASGRHVLRLERDGPFPHLDKLALLPARFAKDPATGDWHVVGQAVDERGLNSAILENWTHYLARVKDNPNSLFALWHAWKQVDDAASPPRVDETAGVAAALLRAPRPRSLGELAARYAQLLGESEHAWKEQQRTSAKKNAALADPTLEAFRQVLVDPAGPLAVPKGVETYYSPESTASLAKLKEDLARLEKARPDVPRTLAVAERKPQSLRVHVRGNHLTLGDEVPRRFPRVLAGDNQPPISDHASGRLELARWLTRGDHPLTSRVMVNRIWQGHFGEGLVRSSDNFGRLGERPDNQPLLDWLARRFVESGWSIKAMHRLILLSSAYRMSTTYDERAAAADPENRLLWRMNRRRLEAEEVRDAILATTGQLDQEMGGTLLANKNHTYVTSTASTNNVNYENQRRSIYLPVVRSAVYDVFSAFDFADPSTMNGRRPSTTVPPQALFMMNSPLMLRQTRAMAERLLGSNALDDAGRVNLAYQLVYSRLPGDSETSRVLQFVGAYRADLAGEKIEPAEARVRAWQALCRVILSSNEFIYLE